MHISRTFISFMVSFMFFAFVCFKESITKSSSTLFLSKQRELYAAQTHTPRATVTAPRSLCDTFNPQHLLIGGNHKTGSKMFCHLLPNTTAQYWSHKCGKVLNDNTPYQGVKSGKAQHLNAFLVHSFVNKYSKAHVPVAVIQIIRKPVDTVLSGYNYHKRTGEKWAKTTISKYTRQRRIHDSSNKRNFYTELCKAMRNDMKNKYGNELMQHSIKTAYNLYNMSIGIELELNLYSLCVFPRVNESYHLIASEMNHLYSNFAFRNFRLEEFETNFNATAEILFDIEGIRKTEDRKELLDLLQTHNVYDGTPHNGHVTQGTYDKQLQIQVLLSDNLRCHTLKEQTLLLGYQWEYSIYC
eukprot:98918_1